MRALICGLSCFVLLGLNACQTLTPPAPKAPLNALIFTTDFGPRDGAVSAMRGVAFAVERELMVSDLTHEIPPFDVWQASLRLQQTYRSWPPGTVFVTVIDPGAGASRRSLVVRTKSGHYFVGPDNGYLTTVIDESPVDAIRVIDESKSRRPDLEAAQAFHARDIYAHVGAQLAAGRLSFEHIGEPSTTPPLRLNLAPAVNKGGTLHGILTLLDVNFGNVWTNVPKSLLTTTFPNARELRVYIARRGQKMFEGTVPVVSTFSAVPRGQPLIYVNSVMNLALAMNQASFARTHHVDAGAEWTIVFSKP